jgi:hypothetical protein
LWKLPCDCEARGHCVCKEMPVIPVNTVVDKKIIIGSTRRKWRHKGSLTPLPPKKRRVWTKYPLT